jgi:uncharacterized phage protein gp47/JayE
MAGLTDAGFTPSTLSEIKTRIKSRLELLNPGFDFRPESPDGQNIDIFSYELSQLWQQLSIIYTSGDPNTATGMGLRNIGHVSGIQMENADRSYATIGLVGTEGTLVEAGSAVSNAAGNVFVTEFDAIIPANIGVIAKVAGATPVLAGSILNIDTAIVGWDSITHDTDGAVGSVVETEQEYRNKRNKAVMAASDSVTGALRGKLILLGMEQVEIFNNDGIAPLVDGTPVGHIHVTITETDLSDEVIAKTILAYKSMGTPTYGTTSVEVADSQGHPHTIYFSKAQAVDIDIALNITFLSTDSSGATDSIKAALLEYVNSLAAYKDVIWSHMFGLITQFGEAQVNSLTLNKLGETLLPANVVIADGEFAQIVSANITITET